MKKLFLTLMVSAGCFVWSFGTDAKIKVACVGNSVTYGAGIKDRANYSYPAQLQQMLGGEYEVRNFGRSSATLLDKGPLPYKAQPEYQAALDFKPDKVIIHLGLNDTDPRAWFYYKDEFVPDYRAMVDTFRKINPEAEIWICRMTPISNRHKRFKAGTRDWYREIQQAIERTAQATGAELIDFQCLLYDRPDLLPDGLHPNEEGAGLLARRVYEALTGDFGGLQMPAIYSDHMVLPRNRPIPVYGTADRGEEITVTLGKQKRKVVTGTDGRWRVLLNAVPAGGPYVLKVKGRNRELVFSDVLSGEIWLCSGQSNMAFPLRQSQNGAEAITGSARPNLRLYNMLPLEQTSGDKWDSVTLERINKHEYYLPTSWQVPGPDNTGNFSAVAYYFGCMLADSLNVPVGLIHNAIGGSPMCSWIDRNTLEEDPVLVDLLSDWLHNFMIREGCRERAERDLAYARTPLQRHPYEPAYLYETGIAPLIDFPIDGVIWYQGESDTHYPQLFEKAFPAVIASWRKAWGYSFPFQYVQISSLDRPGWGEIRDVQRRAGKDLSDVAMTVSLDLGDSLDIHPLRKREIGERLALSALGRWYGFSTEISGPVCTKAVFDRNKAVLSFTHASGLRTADRKEPVGFEIAGKDGCFFPARAVIRGNSVEVSAPQVPDPLHVRYAWQSFSRANLVNEAGFPAGTFRFDGSKGNVD